MRRILLVLCGLGLLASIAVWAISLPGVHWGKPGVLSVHLLDGMLYAENIAYTSEGLSWLNRPVVWSNVRFWPEGRFWFTYPEVTYKVAWVAYLPLWMPAAVFAALMLWMIPWRRRRPPHHCKRCGYDLTGNISGLCPECGASVEQAA
jgi:hypothetical protein